VIAWRDLPDLRDPDRFDFWLQRVLANMCIEHAVETDAGTPGSRSSTSPTTSRATSSRVWSTGTSSIEHSAG
jgi:hypothetical protein